MKCLNKLLYKPQITHITIFLTISKFVYCVNLCKSFRQNHKPESTYPPSIWKDMMFLVTHKACCTHFHPLNTCLFSSSRHCHIASSIITVSIYLMKAYLYLKVCLLTRRHRSTYRHKVLAKLISVNQACTWKLATWFKNYSNLFYFHHIVNM